MKLRSLKAKARKLSGCDGKIRFLTFDRAESVARQQSKRHGAKFQAYHCGTCGGTHTGTAKGREEPRTASVKLQPFRVFAHNGDNVECYIGRAPTKDGGKLAEVIARDGWIVTRVV